MRRWLDAAATAWAILGGCCILAIVLVTTTNITLFGLDRIARSFGGVVSGLPGYEDFVSLMVGAAALMFLPLCQQRRGHVAVDVFTEKLPKAWQNGMDRIWSGLAAVAAVFLGGWMYVAVDVFTEKLPKAWRSGIDRVWSGLAAIAALFLGTWMLIGLEQTRADHALSPVIGWPVWPFYIPGVLSLLLWAVVGLAQALDRQVDGHP